MKAIDFIRKSMQFQDQFSPQFFEDMRDAPLTQPTPRGGNHPLWVLGHLAHSEAELTGTISGEPNPLEEWSGMFAPGTQPTANAADYPPYEEVFEKYRQARARSLKLLDEVGDAGLDDALESIPPGMEEIFRTNADIFMILILHHHVHMGQVADARRAAGRKPLMENPEPAAA